MKQFVELSNDCIIKYKFVENRKDNVPDWVDDKKQKANGKNVTDGVTVLVKNYNESGYTGKLDELWIPKQDILNLAARIMQIDSEQNVVGIPNDDLPF